MGYQLTDKDKEWIEFLRNNPDKQYRHYLGIVENNELSKGCCLGAKLWLSDKENPRYCTQEDEQVTIMSNGSIHYLQNFIDHNLEDSRGSLKEGVVKHGRTFDSLAEMNDSTIWNWSEIADYIEQNPDNVFVIRSHEETPSNTSFNSTQPEL